MLAFQMSSHRFAIASQSGATDPDQSHTAKLPMPRPVAPYDNNIKRAAKNCFDRETGEPVSADLLLTYVEALARYHLHPESKFLNGQPYDRGPTQCRHVEAIAINCIGKEANRWEEQYYLGLSLDAQINYGMSPQNPERLQTALKDAGSILSQREIAHRAGISLVEGGWAQSEEGDPQDSCELLARIFSFLQERVAKNRRTS
jgi:hypothetical protein